MTHSGKLDSVWPAWKLKLTLPQPFFCGAWEERANDKQRMFGNATNVRVPYRTRLGLNRPGDPKLRLGSGGLICKIGLIYKF